MKWVLKFFYFWIKIIFSRSVAVKKILSIPIPMFTVCMCACMCMVWVLKTENLWTQRFSIFQEFTSTTYRMILWCSEHCRHALTPSYPVGRNRTMRNKWSGLSIPSLRGMRMQGTGASTKSPKEHRDLSATLARESDTRDYTL